jgi:uncharacterized tellurite resistance protein B-like protein
MTMKDRLPLVADLLMDAAHADEQLQGEERAAVRRLLRELLGSDALPMDLDFRIAEFSPETFDLDVTAGAFVADPPAQKRHLLELCAAVHGADGELHFKEDEHLRRVAAALGVPEDQYRDLVVDVVEETDVDGSDLDQLRFGPGGPGGGPGDRKID